MAECYIHVQCHHHRCYCCCCRVGKMADRGGLGGLDWGGAGKWLIFQWRTVVVMAATLSGFLTQTTSKASERTALQQIESATRQHVDFM